MSEKLMFHCPKCGEDSKLCMLVRTLAATVSVPTIRCNLCGTFWRISLHEDEEVKGEGTA